MRQNKNAEKLLAEGKKLPTVKTGFTFFDEHFDKTLLALPFMGVFVFIVLPIIFMVCVAFYKL